MEKREKGNGNETWRVDEWLGDCAKTLVKEKCENEEKLKV